MLKLAPGEERKVRVGTTLGSDAVEKSYRIFIEELPPPKNEPDGSNGVQVLTRVGIPIFVAPVKTSAQATVSGVGLAQDGLHFQVDNQGTSHFVPQTLRVRGLAGNGQVVTDHTADGWYILAHSSRRYTMAFDE